MVFNFRHYMEHSNQLNEFTLGQLKSIVEDYPYFQLARILYLKNLYLLQKLDFDCELKKSAVYIYNRPFLHDFLFEQTENKVSIESSDEEAKKKDDITEEDTAPTEENTATEISNEIETKETQITKPKPEEEEEEAKSSKKKLLGQYKSKHI